MTEIAHHGLLSYPMIVETKLQERKDKEGDFQNKVQEK